VFIQTEQTPNPATLKFLPGRAVMAAGTAEFTTIEGAERSPLASRVYGVAGVTRVFLGSDFITVTKAEDIAWAHVKPAILGAIMEHFMSGQPVIAEDEAATVADETGPDREIIATIKELLDTRVRPAVAQDGGDIVFQGYRNGVVLLHMRGSCAGCPSSTATLKNGIENLLRHYVPDIVSVRAV